MGRWYDLGQKPVAVTAHAKQQLVDRLEETPYSDRIAEYLAVTERYARQYCDSSVAVRLDQWAQSYADYGRPGYQSNGDELWAIIRRGNVTTFMLRRSTQDTRPLSFGVDHVEARDCLVR